MKKIIAIFSLILLMASNTYGVISYFVHIDPESKSEFKPTVTVVNESEGIYLVSFKSPVIISNHVGRRPWLIVCDKPRPTEQQQFREFIWTERKSKEGIQVFCRLMPEFGRGYDPKNKDNLQIEVRLDRDIMSRSYIYIDFDEHVYDGGGYFCIDLPAFLDEIEVANQS